MSEFVDDGYSGTSSEDDFDNRTWEVIKTVEDGFKIGALFTRRDITYMAKMLPCLEGMVFRNTKTGKERYLKNKECNIKNIINLARTELKNTEFEHFLFGLDEDRHSLTLLTRRIERAHINRNSFIYDTQFYKMITTFFGDYICPQ